VTSDPPFSRIDLISCRNLLIYLQPYMQARVLRTFHYSLVSGGTLMLGTSESLGEQAGLFTPLDRRSKVYVKKQVATLGLDISGMKAEPPPSLGKRGSPPTVLQVSERRIVERYGPPGALINENWEVLQFHGKTSPFLEHASGVASLNVLKLARREIQMPIRAVVSMALTEGRVASQVVQLPPGSEPEFVRIEAVPVNDPGNDTRCVLVMFVTANESEEVAEPSHSEPATPEDKSTELERELQQTREYLQTTIEELEASNEELKSSNEELQSANEELQSINEEIETSREELQSTNEELTTLNDVLQLRMDELAESNDDLSNVMDSLESMILIVGEDNRLRRFNPSAGRAFSIDPSDIGRPLSRYDSFLGGMKFDALVRDSLDRGVPVDQVVHASNQHWYKMRIAPYRSGDHSFQGAIIFMTDIDLRMRTEEVGRAMESIDGGKLKASEYPVAVVDSSMRVTWVNPHFYSTFQATPEEVVGEHLARLGTGQWGAAGLLEMVRLVFMERKPFRGFVVSHVFQKIGPLTFHVSGGLLEVGQGAPVTVLTFEPLREDAKEAR
jgi:two-component system CheB/CheR fusion protein